MASGDSHQQWGYPHYNQPGQDPGQGNFVNPAFSPAGTDMNTNTFSVSQQWQPQDNQFIQGNGYPSFQSQRQGYSVQNFPGASSHVQSHQHPQPYSAPLSLDSQQDISWDYDFGFDTNSLPGIGDSTMAYGSGLQQGSHSNGLHSSPSFPHDIANTMTSQQQFIAEPSSTPPSHLYPSSQAPAHGSNIQQHPQQGLPQQMNQRHVMQYQQATMNQQQQQPGVNQHQPPNPVQARSQEPNQLRTVNHQQQAPRRGTPQSAGVNTKPRQSPFNGRQVPALSMQKGQFPPQDGLGNPAVPFAASQQTNAPKPSPSLSNTPTAQSRFLPPQTMPAQRPIQSPASPASTAALPNVVAKAQQGIQPNFQLNIQPNIQPKAAVPTVSAAPSQQSSAGGLASPRVATRHENAVPFTGSRYVGFTIAPVLDIEGNTWGDEPISEVLDPDEIVREPFGWCFPAQNGQPRTLASSLIHDWSKSLDRDDVAGQNQQEQRLKQHLGGAMPKYYEDALQEAKAAKLKGSAKPGPKRSKTRPADAADAAEWDALGITYLPNPQPTGSEIGAAVAAYGKLIRGLTVEFQAVKQKLKSAKDADIVALKEKVARRQEIIYRAVEAANKWGDRQVLANLGGNQKLISDFVTSLIHANNSADHNGKAPKAVLRLMSEVTTMEKDFLMTSLNFAKISKKFESKGDSEVKATVKKIRENVENRNETSATSTPESTLPAKAMPTSSAESKGMASSDATKKTTSTVTQVPSTSSKRPRDEEIDTKSVKRIASESATAQTSQPVQKTTSSKVVISAPNTTITQSKLFSGGGILSGKVRPVAKPVTKALPAKPDIVKTESPTTAKLELKKEPNKPGLSRPEATKARKTELSKAETSAASKLGGIGALLDEISKPKQPGRVTPDKDPKIEKDETPEEKARRLRKEKRRHLRVSWREGDELTEVRVFHKDDGEDEGRASNMIRDAHDDRSEGMMLKQGLKEGMQLDEEDEEDELPYRPWFQPPGIDFSLIPQDKRVKYFVTRGGLVNFETQQQKLIVERENKELMVVYTDPSDIPPTPKSPHMPTQEDTDMQTGVVATLADDEPQLAEIHRRWTEAGSRGLSWARLNALRRAQKGQSSFDATSYVNTMHSTMPSASGPITNGRTMSKHDQVLVLLTSDRVKNWKDPDPYDAASPKTHRRHDYENPEVQRAAEHIGEVVERLKGKPAPPNEPPEWMKHDSARVAEWWHGYNKDKQRAEHRAQQQQQMQAAQPSIAAQPHAAPQAAQSTADQQAAAWAAYYAQLQQHQQGQAQPAQQNPYEQGYGNAYSAYFQGAQTTQQQAAPTQAAGDSNAQLQAVLAALGAAPAPAQDQQQSAQSSTDPQLQALLASLAGTSTAQAAVQSYQPQPPQYVPSPADPNQLAYIMSLAAGRTPEPDDNRDRDRDRDVEQIHPSRREKSRGHKTNGNVHPHIRGINPNKIGTKPCTFYAKGMCNKGDQCTFRHD